MKGLNKAIHKHEQTDNDDRYALDEDFNTLEHDEQYQALRVFLALHILRVDEIIGCSSLIAGQDIGEGAFFCVNDAFNRSTIYYGKEFEVTYDPTFNVFSFDNMYDHEKWYSPSLLAGLMQVNKLESTRTNLGQVRV